MEMRKNLQTNKSVEAQIDQGLQSGEPSKSESPQASVTSASKRKQRSVQCWQCGGWGHTSKQYPTL